jgi:hypothetical protein
MTQLRGTSNSRWSALDFSLVALLAAATVWGCAALLSLLSSSPVAKLNAACAAHSGVQQVVTTYGWLPLVTVVCKDGVVVKKPR